MSHAAAADSATNPGQHTPNGATMLALTHRALTSANLEERIYRLLTAGTATPRLLTRSLPTLAVLLEQAAELGIAPLSDVDAEWAWALRGRTVRPQEQHRAMVMIDFGPLARLGTCADCTTYPVSILIHPEVVYDRSQTDGTAVTGIAVSPAEAATHMAQVTGNQLAALGYSLAWLHSRTGGVEVDHDQRAVCVAGPTDPKITAAVAAATASVFAHPRLTCRCGKRVQVFNLP